MSRRLLLFYLFCDFLAIALASVAAFWLRFNIELFPVRPEPDMLIYLRLGFFSSTIGVLCLQVNLIYNKVLRRINIDIIFDILKSMALSGFLVILISFLFRELIVLNGQETMSRLIIGISFLLSCLTLVVWRITFLLLLRKVRNRGWGQIRILIVGEGKEIDNLEELFSGQVHDYKIVGYCGPETSTDIPQLGLLEDIQRVVGLHGVQEVIMADGNSSPERLLGVMKECERAGTRFSMVPQASTLLLLPADLYEVGGVPLMVPRRRLDLRASLWLKRFLDILFSALFLIVTSPIVLLTTVAIRLDTSGPIIYKQKRIGLQRRPFWIYKFRSMSVNADKLPAPPGPLDRKSDEKHEEVIDPRVTRVGFWLRRLSIDEFPQFINVLKGEMSIVGPRPHIPSEVERYEPWHHKRFDVQPGITGLTQVSGRKNLDIDGMVRLDIYYIENWSLLMDIKIMLQTVPALLTGRGAY